MFRKSTSPLRPFCKLSDETVLYLFYECNIIQKLWNDLALFFESDFTLFYLTPQATFLCFLNVDSKLLLLQNHLIFKIYIYSSRRSESLILKSLIREITKVKNIEEKVSMNNEKKDIICTRENGNRLKMFGRPKLFDTLSDSASECVRVGVDQGSRQKKLVFSNQRAG